MSSPFEFNFPQRSVSAPAAMRSTPEPEVPLLIDDINELWDPTLDALSRLSSTVDELDHQFDLFVTDPNRRSNEISKQFRYKVALNHWYHQAIPAAKRDLLRRLSFFWTDTPIGRAWMHVCTDLLLVVSPQLVLVVRERTERACRMIVDMQRRVDRKFMDMAQMTLLNPIWRNAEKDRFFGSRGPLRAIPRELTPEGDGAEGEVEVEDVEDV